MQISRHWRMKSLRYRLEGVRRPNGDCCLQPSRPAVPAVEPVRETARTQTAVVARVAVPVTP